MRFTTHLLPSRSGNLGILLLNNPKPLHALNLDMMHCLQDMLQQWYRDDTLAAVLVKASNSETKIPAFCAGGDVKQVYLSGLTTKGDNNEPPHGQGVPGLDTAEFFRQEYYANHMLATANKPQISLWDGVVMGGGVGISIHGAYRVATERTVWAMPETAIGLFPDVGSLYWMPRLLTVGMANYLALTGARLKAPDLIATGIATHYVPSHLLEELEDALVKASTQNAPTEQATPDGMAPVLQSFHETPSGRPQLDHAAIEQAFGAGAADHEQPPTAITVEGIVRNLEGLQDTEFGRTTLATLQKMSPTSLKVTLEGLRRGRAAASITDDLRLEYRIAQACMRPGSDFYEGIRAVLIDKDNQPVWNPASLEEVTEDRVESHFAPIAHEWELPPELVVKTTKTSKL